MIPAVLAWLGVVASVLWIIGLPLQLVGILRRYGYLVIYPDGGVRGSLRPVAINQGSDGFDNYQSPARGGELIPL
jgi:hypothetical protein